MDDRREECGQRFVILRHELPALSGRASHWDLMLEKQGMLMTWELPSLALTPLPATFEQLGIRRLADHRLAYLDFEGSISHGRGQVWRVDFGCFRIAAEEFDESLQLTAQGSSYTFGLQLPKAIFAAVDVLSEANEATVASAIDNAQHYAVVHWTAARHGGQAMSAK